MTCSPLTRWSLLLWLLLGALLLHSPPRAAAPGPSGAPYASGLGTGP